MVNILFFFMCTASPAVPVHSQSQAPVHSSKELPWVHQHDINLDFFFFFAFDSDFPQVPPHCRAAARGRMCSIKVRYNSEGEITSEFITLQLRVCWSSVLGAAGCARAGSGAVSSEIHVLQVKGLLNIGTGVQCPSLEVSSPLLRQAGDGAQLGFSLGGIFQPS